MQAEDLLILRSRTGIIALYLKVFNGSIYFLIILIIQIIHEIRNSEIIIYLFELSHIYFQFLKYKGK